MPTKRAFQRAPVRRGCLKNRWGRRRCWKKRVFKWTDLFFSVYEYFFRREDFTHTVPIVSINFLYKIKALLNRCCFSKFTFYTVAYWLIEEFTSEKYWCNQSEKRFTFFSWCIDLGGAALGGLISFTKFPIEEWMLQLLHRLFCTYFVDISLKVLN